MFCAKCGNLLEDGSCRCNNCGWKWEETENEIENEVEIESQETDEENSDTLPEPEIDITPDDNSVYPSQTKMNMKKTGIIGCAICVMAVVAFIIAMSVYQNSAPYKIAVAAELIEEGKYSEAIEKLYDVYTPQAIAIKNYVTVENAKQTFEDAADDDIEDAREAYYDFQSALDEFDRENETYNLPDNLRENYDCYSAAFDYINEYTGAASDEVNEMREALFDVQEVMLNEVDMNNSSDDEDVFFTLNSLQERVDTSKSALKILKNYNFDRIEVNDSDVELYCNIYFVEGKEPVIETSDLLSQTVDDLKSYCKSEIKSSQKVIKRDAEKFEMDANLYRIKPIDNYSSYVGSNLKEIRIPGDIYDNRETILTILKRDMLYHLISGYALN